MPNPRVLVVLSGCGFLDGSEIHESVIVLLALDRAGFDVVCAAPDRPQMHVVDHLAGEPSGESRNVLVESARIARGQVVDLASIDAADYAGLFMPGGYGAAKNLSTVATEGAGATVNADLVRILREFRAQQKPIGAVCISPAVLVAALREGEVTIGNDPGTASAIQQMGGEHHACAVTELHVDVARKIVTAPAYMYHARIGDVATGIEKAVRAFAEMIK